MSNLQTLKRITHLRAQVRKLWIKACEFDGIKPSSQFVIFSDSNKFQAQYNAKMGEYLAACRSYEQGF